VSAAPAEPFPAGRTAPRPPEERGLARDEVRLLVATDDALVHARFRDLPTHLRPGDVLVVNTSATVPAQVDGTLLPSPDQPQEPARPVVVHVAPALPDGAWVVELRRAPDADRAVLDARPGQHVLLPGGAVLALAEPYPAAGSSPTGTGNRLWRAWPRPGLDRVPYLLRHGRPIAYGYLDRPYPLPAYQTVFATQPGSAEMPSAARPFTAELVTRLVARGVVVLPVTLHTGLSSQEDGEVPQPEWFEVPEPTAALVTAARRRGGRVVAVGTSATRALESAVDATEMVARSGWRDPGVARAGQTDRVVTKSGRTDRVVARCGWTDRVITPEDPPRVVDGLITGWHDPQASHLRLVQAVAGTSLTRRAYDAAGAAGYLWHEFGDSALLLPRRARVRAAPEPAAREG
jgi:S-adenosylmethionine:tRNA ribosyltransferase-isomerase